MIINVAKADVNTNINIISSKLLLMRTPNTIKKIDDTATATSALCSLFNLYRLLKYGLIRSINGRMVLKKQEFD